MSSRLQLFFVYFELLLGFIALSDMAHTVNLTIQPESATLIIDGTASNHFNKNHCNSAQQVKIKLPQKVYDNFSNFRYKFLRVGNLDATKSTPQTLCGTKSESKSDSKTFPKNEPMILSEKFLTPNACKGEGEAASQILCIYEDDNADKQFVAYAIYNFNTKMAKVNDIRDIVAVNGQIDFHVDYTKGGGGAPTFEVCYKTSQDSKEACKQFNVDDIKLTGLMNHTLYTFRVRLKEGQNDWTDWSKAYKATPKPAAFPLNTYQGAGGELSCAQSPASSLILLALSLLFLFLMRQRNSSKKSKIFLLTLTAALSLTLGAPKDAQAEAGQLNFGLLGSMYRPDLDSEQLSSGQNIFPFYKCFFRRDKKDVEGAINPLVGAEFDWHVWDGFGSLQLGFGVGYTFKTGHALEIQANGKPDCNSPIEDAQVSLHMYQIRPQLTYIFDPYIDYFPVAPYIRGALVAHGYVFSPQKESALINQNIITKPNGFRFGYQAAVGLMLRMDFLEPSAVKSAYSAGLFKHVYLKTELSMLKIDTFGRPGFQFSAKDIMGTKLPLMWTFAFVFEMP